MLAAVGVLVAAAAARVVLLERRKRAAPADRTAGRTQAPGGHAPAAAGKQVPYALQVGATLGGILSSLATLAGLFLKDS